MLQLHHTALHARPIAITLYNNNNNNNNTDNGAIASARTIWWRERAKTVERLEANYF